MLLPMVYQLQVRIKKVSHIQRGLRIVFLSPTS